jgi:hypothetical protein
MILGIDISTTTTAFTILDEDGKIVLCEAVRLEKLKDIFVKAANIKKYVENLNKTYNIKAVYVEEPLMSFSAGMSSAKTISTLMRFNGIVSWICCDVIGLDPQFISAATARKMYGVKMEKGRKAKEVVFEAVLDKETDFKVEYTAHGNPVPGSIDKSDSFIIAKAGYSLWKSLKS